MRIAAHGIRRTSPTTTRGDRLDRADEVAAAAQGRAADGQAHHHRRHQPDHDGRAVDGHHRRVHQRPRPRPAGRAGPERAPRRRRLRARHLHRADGDHARPGDDRRQRARRDSWPAARPRTWPPRRQRPAAGRRGGDGRLRLPLPALRLRGQALGVQPRRSGSPNGVQSGVDWISTNWSGATTAIANGFTNASSTSCSTCWPARRGSSPPWRSSRIAMILGGWRAGVAAVDLPGGAALARAVERRDDHADLDPGRDRAW